MGRKAKFDKQALAQAALHLAAEGGPRAVTIAAIAERIGAPTGSFYHRYSSRDQLLGELWMDVVESFQRELVERLAEARDVEGAAQAALLMVSWTREHLPESRLLLLHHRRDFMPGDWPPALVERAAALDAQLGAALTAFARRAFGRSGKDVMTRLRFALLDAPFGGIKPYVRAGTPAPHIVDELVADVVRCILGPLDGARHSTSNLETIS